MHTFLKYINENTLTSILQIDKGRGPFKYLFEIIRAQFSNIWILVMTENKHLDRYENRNIYEVIYNKYDSYKNNYPRFDLVMVSTSSVWDLSKIKSLGKRVAFFSPFNLETPPHLHNHCNVIRTFYNLSSKLEWLPLPIKLFIGKYRIFSDRSFKIVVGEFK